MQPLKRNQSFSIIKESLNFLIAKMLPGVAYLFLVNLASAKLGQERYGEFSTITALTIMLGSFSVGWFNQYQLRLAGQTLVPNLSKLNKRRILAIAIVVFFGSCYGALKQNDGITYVVPFAVSAYAVYLLKLVSFQASLQTRTFKKFEMYRAIAILVLALSLNFVEVSGLQLVFLFAFTYLVPLLIVRDRHQTPMKMLDRHQVSSAFNYGWPISIWLAVMASQSVYERWLVGYFMTQADQGQYAAVQDAIVRAAAIAIMPMTMAVHAMYMRASNGGDIFSAGKVLNVARKWIAVIAIAALCGWFLNVDRIFFRIFSGIQPMDRNVFWLLVSAAIAWQMALLSHKPLEKAKRTLLMLTICVVSLSIYYASAFVLVPIFGIIAIPCASLSAALLYSTLCIYLTRVEIPGVAK